MKRLTTLTTLVLLLSGAGAAPSLPGQTTSTAQKRAALQKACNSGALSADECSERMAALNGGAQAQPAQGEASDDTGGAYRARGDIAGAIEYRDPQGRYTLSIPRGWKVDGSQGNLKISQGETWAIFETSSSNGQPLDVAQQSAAQMQPMYQSWSVFNQGPFTTHLHHPAAGMVVGAAVASKTGTKQVVMLFAAQGAGGSHYLTMTSSSDQASAQKNNALLMQVFESVRFNGQ